MLHRVDDLIHSSFSLLSQRLSTIGAEEIILSQEALIEEGAGSRGGGLILSPRDKEGHRAGLRGDRPLWAAHQELAAACIGLPEEKAQGISSSVAAHLNALSHQLSCWVRIALT